MRVRFFCMLLCVPLLFCLALSACTDPPDDPEQDIAQGEQPSDDDTPGDPPDSEQSTDESANPLDQNPELPSEDMPDLSHNPEEDGEFDNNGDEQHTKRY